MILQGLTMSDFFIKLFKAFNSSQTPWQMSLALAMGMAMGLTPYSGIQTIVLIFAAFIINIHIGLFLVSSTLFAGVAYLADPYFEQLGFLLLNSEFLKEFFTSLYNSGLFRLTYFNNTLVLGSNVIAFMLLLPMFFILNKLVYVYRDKIAAKLQQYRILRTLGIEVSDKKDKMLRVWGIALFGVLGGLVALFNIVFLDSIVKGVMQESFSRVLKKKVSIENLNISLSKAEIDIDNLYVADDKKALLYTKNINLDIDFNQLLFQRYQIENLNLSGMEFNSEVDDKGLLYTKATSSKASKETKTDSKKSEFKLPSLSLEDPKVLIDRMGLSSISKFEDAKKRVTEVKTKYKSLVQNEFSKSELNALKDEVKALKESLKSKDIETILKLKDDLSKLNKKIKAKKELLSKTKKEFLNDKNALKNDYKTLSESGVDDYNKLKNQYTFDKDGGVNVIGVLFGDKIKTYLATFMKYYEVAKPYLKKDDEETKESLPPRGEGRWISFREYEPSVKFLVKKMNVDGLLKEQAFSAVVNNISSNQKLLNKPMSYTFKSDGEKFKEFSAIGEDNHLQEDIKTTSNYSLARGMAQGIDLDFMNLDKGFYSLKGSLDAKNYMELSSVSTVLFSDVTLSLKKADNKLMKTLEDVVSKIDEFDLKIKFNGSLETPELSVKSNLDKKLSGALSSLFEKEVQKYQTKLKEMIDVKVKEKLNELRVHGNEIKEIDELLNSGTLDINDLSSSTKVIEEAIKNKAKKKLENKAKNLLKLF